VTDRYAVAGNPIAHSKSPFIHAQFARQTSQDVQYERLLAPLDGFRAAVENFRAAGGRGLNVTLPFKLEAFELAQERSDRAADAQVVNTLKFDGSTLYGEGTASDELYVAAKALADREGTILNNHVGFDLDLATAMERNWGKPRFVHLAELGVLGPNTTFVHMNLIRDEEIDPIVQSGLSIVWCPLAYVSRGTPLRAHTRIPDMKKRGVNVALGTDSARQSSAGDAGFLALQLAGGAGHAMVSEDVFEMLTIGGAQAAGLSHLIGSLSQSNALIVVPETTTSVDAGAIVDVLVLDRNF